jgi:hypothetical protein
LMHMEQSSCADRNFSAPLQSTFQPSAPPFTFSSLSRNATSEARNSVTLLQTAIVPVQDGNGEWIPIRAFLDSGSESNFITTDAARALKLPFSRTNVIANGIGGSCAVKVKHKVSAIIGNEDECFHLDLLVTPKITNFTPSRQVAVNKLEIPPNLVLADSTFGSPGKVDILIGNQLYGDLLRDGNIKLICGVTLLNNFFGWTFAGNVPAAGEDLEEDSPSSGVHQATTTCHFQNLAELKSEQKLKAYKLNTVTYGTAAVPYKATRCLQEVGIENREKFPEVAEAIIDHTCVDDVVTGAKNPREAKRLGSDLVTTFASAGMNPQNLYSNDDGFLQSIPEHLAIIPPVDGTIKTLGLKWNPSDDMIGFVTRPMRFENITRRIILSEIVSKFDLDDLFGPVTFTFKKFLKNVFRLKPPWNERVPEQLHGFCDSLNAGYDACVCIVSTDAQSRRISTLICAKSRIFHKEYNPTAMLELCGAVILANQMKKVAEALHLQMKKVAEALHLQESKKVCVLLHKDRPPGNRLKPDDFLAALDKFISRRGLPSTIHSDNGLAFQGAANKLKELHQLLSKEKTQNNIRVHLLHQEVEWKFTPPRAHAMGGLWEAAVKSFKSHFYCVACNARLTFEELDLLKFKIEVILNFRPPPKQARLAASRPRAAAT